jgi:hypothetical protein
MTPSACQIAQTYVTSVVGSDHGHLEYLNQSVYLAPQPHSKTQNFLEAHLPNYQQN